MNVPAEFSALPDLLRLRARTEPDRPFVRFKGRGFTYGNFDARTDAFASGLSELGIAAGDVVSVFLPNCLEFLEAWWAILKVGAVLGPINPAYTGPEAAYVIGHSGAVAVVTDATRFPVISAERAGLPHLRDVITIDAGGDFLWADLSTRGGATPSLRRGLDDLSAILYTSGTTGKPKGAMLTHRNQLVNATMGAELVPLARGERIGMVLPLFHTNAQISTVLIPMTVACEVVMWPHFSASTFWQTVEELQPACVSAVPTILAAVLHAESAPPGPTSLRFMLCGAAPLSVELLETFQLRFGIRILEGYGLTETTCVSSINPYYGERKAGSIGLPVRGQQMRIASATGGTVATGEYGEIVIKGPNVMAGYLNDEKATAETIRDGWLYTGDIGYVDEDGYFFIVDRSKDMIIRGGENIYPREVEEVLYAHHAVLECAVIGVPDAVRGEEVLAIVAPKPNVQLELEDLAAFAAAKLAKYKLPSRFEIREELPKTANGKISKGPLRTEFGSWSAGTVKR